LAGIGYFSTVVIINWAYRLMKPIFRIALCAALATVPSVQAQTDDVVRVVNRLRAPGGACTAHAPPLVKQGALDLTALRLARGASLTAALKSTGYGASEAQVITLAGEGWRGQLESLLASRFCSQVAMPALSEAGSYESGNRIWIVLASPQLAPKLGLARQQLVERTLMLVNDARGRARNCGARHFGSARPLRWNVVLARSAALHAADMAANGFFSHTGHNGSTLPQRVTRAGYPFRVIGENIAAGQPSIEDAIAGWLKSPEHCANLMNSEFTDIGAAFDFNDTNGMRVYWVQDFGTPR
jgi:uncharacterized protein YkwD